MHCRLCLRNEESLCLTHTHQYLYQVIFRLTCTLSMLVAITHWYQQKPGSPPCYLLYYYSESDKHHGSGITSCFPGPMDTSANAGLLLILGLQPEDEADYYCGILHSSGSSYSYPQCLRK
uniref:Immunoglobulin V-set domain-containing protein n=1 Tax=Canis lupus dingo TaxID=286419 RepID=A0A8C0JR88_CANLU